MDNMGFIFGMLGMTVGIIGFVFAIISFSKVDKLEKKLTKSGVLD